ncbi:MAG TPA: hypothetical protein VKU62_02840 [Thermoanaerobaculia bacterium]|nr:hypothetical protein [Thermoanaerobaculia bacterium]
MRRVLFGFIAGFLGTIIFHQIALELLHLAGLTPRSAWSMQQVPPFGVPSVISLSFWGGVWGIILALVFARVRGAAYWIGAILFGAILPTLVAAFVVAPLKHQPMPHTPSMAVLGLTVNGAWGFGTALFYRLFSRK